MIIHFIARKGKWHKNTRSRCEIQATSDTNQRHILIAYPMLVLFEPPKANYILRLTGPCQPLETISYFLAWPDKKSFIMIQVTAGCWPDQSEICHSQGLKSSIHSWNCSIDFIRLEMEPESNSQEENWHGNHLIDETSSGSIKSLEW